MQASQTMLKKIKKFWFVGPNLTKKVFSIQNRANEHYHRIPHIRISLGIKLYLNHTILTFRTKLVLKRKFTIQKRKFEHHHRIQHIRISLDTEFHLKHTTLIFGPDLLKKSIFGPKQ